MKKTLFCLIAVLFACIVLVNVSYAALTPTKSLSVTATVPSNTPAMEINIYKNGSPDPARLITGTTLAFGTLQPGVGPVVEGPGVWYSPDYYCVQIYTQGYSFKYEVRSSCSGIGTISNTNSYFVLTPVYNAGDLFDPNDPNSDQGAKPAAATVGTIGSAIATNKVIYASEVAPSTSRILQAYYSIPQHPFDAAGNALPIPYTGWTGLPLSQASGSYTGTVTLSIVAI